MRQTVKKFLNAFFMKTLSYRVVHNQLVIDSDMEVWESLREHGFRPRTIIDVGAAQGLWTDYVAKIFPDSSFLMVDPLSDNEKALKATAEKFPRVRYWMGALGREAGELELYVHGDQSSMFISDWGRKGTFGRVRMKRLDDLVKEMGCRDVDAVKLDVQGAELEVLAGASETLRQCKVVQVEVSFRRVYEKAPLAHEIISFFATQGFRIYDIASFYKRHDRALLQGDMFFVRDDSLFSPETWEL